MKKGTQVSVKMPRGSDRSGKYVGKEESRGMWYIIQPLEKGSATFKARPASVREV